MDKFYRNILDKIFTEADILFGDISLLKGIILGEEKGEYLKHKSLFRLVKSGEKAPMTNIDNLIGLSANPKKEDADNMLIEIEIKGISVDKKPRKDGRWQARYKNDGCWHSVYGISYEDAKDKAIKAKETAPKSSNKPRFEEYFNKWHKLYKVPYVDGDYAKTNKSYIDRLAEKIGHIRIDRLTSDILQENILAVFPGNNTRYKVKVLVNECLEKARIDRLIKFNPIEGVNIKNCKSERYPVFEIPDQDTIFNAITVPAYRKIFYLCCCTGMRISEALGLRFEDFDTQNMYVTVNKQFTRHMNGIHF
jgi:hypothetical protein